MDAFCGWFDTQFKGSPQNPATTEITLTTAPDPTGATHWGQQVGWRAGGGGRRPAAGRHGGHSTPLLLPPAARCVCRPPAPSACPSTLNPFPRPAPPLPAVLLPAPARRVRRGRHAGVRDRGGAPQGQPAADGRDGAAPQRGAAGRRAHVLLAHRVRRAPAAALVSCDPMPCLYHRARYTDSCKTERACEKEGDSQNQEKRAWKNESGGNK